MEQSLDSVTLVPEVRIHRGHGPTMAEPEGDERPTGRLTAKNHLVERWRPASVLHPEVVLVREEVGGAVVGHRVAEHRLSGRRPLVEGGRPMLEADAGAVAGMERIGHVPCCEDPRDARSKVLVDDDAVVDAESRGPGELNPRRHPQTNDDDRGGEHGTVREPNRLHCARSEQSFYANVEVEVDAVFGIQVPVDRSHLEAEDALERIRGELDYGDRGPELAGRGRYLRSDPPRSYYNGLDGISVYLRDIWPTTTEIKDVVDSCLEATIFTHSYRDVLTGDERWRGMDVSTSEMFYWDPESTYVRSPPYFEEMPREPYTLQDIVGARVLAYLGNSVTTDHISPAGVIQKDSPAGRYLIEHGVSLGDFNSYGSRRVADWVGGRVSRPPPTPPDMRARIRRFVMCFSSETMWI